MDPPEASLNDPQPLFSFAFPPGHTDPISALGLLVPTHPLQVPAWLRNAAIAIGLSILMLLASGFWAKRRVLRL
jgi:hypothetical protein